MNLNCSSEFFQIIWKLIKNFQKSMKEIEKNDFFEKSPKTKKNIFFDFFQDFQNSSSIFGKNQKQLFKQ